MIKSFGLNFTSLSAWAMKDRDCGFFDGDGPAMIA
jgi:hypothetical protein